MPRKNMIHCEAGVTLPAILTGIIIPPKDLAPRQLDVWARPMNLDFQSNDRWTGN
jgi:hypothetical protein